VHGALVPKKKKIAKRRHEKHKTRFLNAHYICPLEIVVTRTNMLDDTYP